MKKLFVFFSIPFVFSFATNANSATITEGASSATCTTGVVSGTSTTCTTGYLNPLSGTTNLRVAGSISYQNLFGTTTQFPAKIYVSNCSNSVIYSNAAAKAPGFDLLVAESPGVKAKIEVGSLTSVENNLFTNSSSKIAYRVYVGKK